MRTFALRYKCYNCAIKLEAISAMIENAPVTEETVNLRNSIRQIGMQFSQLKSLQVKNALNESE
jgi:predicted nucleic acid-binding Zn ribbon protein